MVGQFNNVLDTIGNTPIVRVNSLDTGVCELYLKLENLNPGGSIKDRMALSMIDDAEKKGLLQKGSVIVEATAGNTGLGLAMVSASKGYSLILVMPDKMSKEKVDHLQAMGAEVILTRSDVAKGHPEYYQDLAKSIAESTPAAFYIDQFNNPANPLAHELTTAPEIWEQMNKDVDVIVAGVGSAGTITGLTRYFKKIKPHLEIILADPFGSILKDFAEKKALSKAGSWLVEGIGEDFVPSMLDFSMVQEAFSITDKESFLTARNLLKKEGILAGSSTGTLVAAALKYAKKQTKPKKIVTFVCDSGNKYMSKMYNNGWMIENGFLNPEEES